jgi:CubicO group peptidase (beta-lactamase class C family)
MTARKDKDEWTEEEVAEWLEKNKDKLSEKDWGKDKKDVPEHRLVPVDTPVTIHHLLTHTSGLTGVGIQESPKSPLTRHSMNSCVNECSIRWR